MEKKKSTFESHTIDHPLIELVDVQVPYQEPADERSSKPKSSDRNGKTVTDHAKKKKPTRRRKN